MVEPFDTNFKHLSPADFIMLIDGVADSLARHPGFKDRIWTEYAHSPPQLKAAVAVYKQAVSAAANGDRQRIAERTEIRAELEEAAHFVAQFVVMVAKKEKDPSLLLNTGFPLKKQTTGYKVSNHAVLSAPLKWTAKHGPKSGTVVIKVIRVKGAVTVDVQICEGNPGDESSWTLAKTSSRFGRIELTGLEPGKRYYFRVRFMGADGYTEWTTYLTLIVI